MQAPPHYKRISMINKPILGTIFAVIVLIHVILQEKIRDSNKELFLWLEKNPYSVPLIIMLIAIVESIFLMPVEYLTLGTA